MNIWIKKIVRIEKMFSSFEEGCLRLNLIKAADQQKRNR